MLIVDRDKRMRTHWQIIRDVDLSMHASHLTKLVIFKEVKYNNQLKEVKYNNQRNHELRWTEILPLSQK
jgi:hypothetical protein